MQATELLKQEHRVIEQVLNCLERMAQRLEGEGELDAEAARQALDFLRNFADRCHHGKEEDCLFPLLEEKGFSRTQGPTGVMLHEHEAGRRHVGAMAEAVEGAAAGDAAASTEFVAHARQFVQLLREHIQKEDHCLFEMTDQALSQQEQSQLLDSFAKVEHDDMEPGTHEKYLEIAAGLAKRYGVSDRATDSSAGANCCGQL